VLPLLLLLLLTLTPHACLCQPTVLVLGSGGLIGRHLAAQLAVDGYRVAHVYNRTHIDLRVPGALDRFNASSIAYVFFLACEVGGSKYIAAGAHDTQIDILRSNLRIYETVFPWLRERRVPFLFASSCLAVEDTPYGAVKRLGEQWTRQLQHLGRFVRFWNVYGPEPLSAKSHVVPDWARQCAANGTIRAWAHPHEARQFVHAADVARALILVMQHHATMPMRIDVSSGAWVTLQQLADRMCPAVFDPPSTEPRPRYTPVRKGLLYQLWRRHMPLRTGIESVRAAILTESVTAHEK